MHISKLLFTVFLTNLLLAQPAINPVKPTPVSERLNGYKAKMELREQSLFKNVPAVSLGPTVMSARIVDVDVNPANTNEFYVAYASGGVWRTSNSGTSFTPVFEDQPVMTIGDIAVDWKSHTIYIGTGEKNSSRSSYSGTGIYASADTGKTWQHLGLGEIHRTGRIIIDKNNSGTLYVAALGHLYSPNKERGIYKTADGGKNWKHVLMIDENTGGIDIIQDNGNPDVLYAAMWYRTRRAWDFEESGKTSGIYKSTDRGETWKKINNDKNGFPDNEGVGRIGLSMMPGNSNIIYAILDNQNRRKDTKPEPVTLTKNMLRTMSKEDFLKKSNDEINQYLDYFGFPDEYSAAKIKKAVEKDEYKPAALVEYLEDGNAMLFDTPVIGAEIYKSTNAGAAWTKTHEKPIEDFVYSYGYYFGEMNVDPNDENILYILGVPILKSTDGGKSFFSIQKENAHVDHHILWVNPNNSKHLINGNDGGLNISYDGGETWVLCNTPAVGQFYTVSVDNAEPYNVYGGLQDNGVWYGPSTYKAGVSWHMSGEYPYKRLMGGDGMEIAVDSRDNQTVYTGYQFGNYFRIDRNSGKSKYISPVHDLGSRPYRFNWKTPVRLSLHNQDIVYFAGQNLFRSMDKGETWKVISKDLTTGGKRGDVPFSTITAIAESPSEFGVIYTGSDDGLVHLTRDGGVTWTNITAGLPQNYWVSSVVASVHKKERVYVTLTGYRWDNFTPYIFQSDDYGKTWLRLGSNMPAEPVNAILEDPVNQNLLYAGTGHSLYISLNGGKDFYPFKGGLPAAPVHALAYQAREKDLVLGTHGRSLYKINVEEIQQLNDELTAKTIHLFSGDIKVQFDKNQGNKTYEWSDTRIRKAEISYYLMTEGEAELTVSADSGEVLFTKTIKSDRGINYFSYPLEVTEQGNQILAKKEKKPDAENLKKKDDGKYYLTSGKYTFTLSAGGEKVEGKLEVKERKSSRE